MGHYKICYLKGELTITAQTLTAAGCFAGEQEFIETLNKVHSFAFIQGKNGKLDRLFLYYNNFQNYMLFYEVEDD